MHYLPWLATSCCERIQKLDYSADRFGGYVEWQAFQRSPCCCTPNRNAGGICWQCLGSRSFRSLHCIMFTKANAQGVIFRTDFLKINSKFFPCTIVHMTNLSIKTAIWYPSSPGCLKLLETFFFLKTVFNFLPHFIVSCLVFQTKSNFTVITIYLFSFSYIYNSYAIFFYW